MVNPYLVSHFNQSISSYEPYLTPSPRAFSLQWKPRMVRVGSFILPLSWDGLCSLQLLNKSMSMFQALLCSSLSRLWATTLPTSSGKQMGKATSKNGPSIRLWPPRPTADLWRSLWRHSSFPFSSRKLRRARTLLQVYGDRPLSIQARRVTASKSGVALRSRGGEERAFLSRGPQK